MIKLVDGRVATLIHVMEYNLPVPKDLSKFPTIQMLLDKGLIVVDENGRLAATSKPECIAYRAVVFSHWTKEFGTKNFEELDEAGKLLRGAEIPERYFFWDAIELRREIAKLNGYLPTGFEFLNPELIKLAKIGNFLPEEKELEAIRVATVLPSNDIANMIKAVDLIRDFFRKYPSGPRPLSETDLHYQRRMIDIAPERYEEINTATGKALDVIGVQLNCPRLTK